MYKLQWRILYTVRQYIIYAIQWIGSEYWAPKAWILGVHGMNYCSFSLAVTWIVIDYNVKKVSSALAGSKYWAHLVHEIMRSWYFVIALSKECICFNNCPIIEHNLISTVYYYQCWSESGLGLGFNGWVQVRVRTRTLPSWTRTRTRTRTPPLWTRTLVSWTRTRTRTRTRTQSESRRVQWEM